MLYVTIDLETTGLHKYLDKITMLGMLVVDSETLEEYSRVYVNTSLPMENLFSGEVEELIDNINIFNLDQCKEDLDAILTSRPRDQIKLIGHNSKFDGGFIYVHLGLDIFFDHDTMILIYLHSTAPELIFNRGKWLGLKDAAPRILGVEPWDVSLAVKTDITQESIDYLRLDVLHTYGLFKYYKKNFDLNVRITYRLIMKALDAFKHVELNGIYLDSKRLSETALKYTGISNKILGELNTDYPGVNFNSPAQVGEILYEKLGLPINHLTESGKPSVGAVALAELKGEHPIVDKILEYKKITKALTFLTDWQDRLLHSRLFPTFNLHTAITGRTSCSNPNIQQVPRNKDLKSIFTAPEGYVFVQADYSQMELRVVAHVANIKAMKEIYENDGDIHRATAQEIVGKEDITPAERTLAKPVNFGFIYGMSAETFPEYAKVTYGMDFTVSQAIDLRLSYFNKYPELLMFYEQTEMEMKTHGYIKTFMGRYYKTGYEILLQDKFRSSFRRKVINAKVQSPASDIALLAIIELEKRIRNTDDKIVGAVHDSILFEIKNDEHLDYKLGIIKRTMENPSALNPLLKLLGHEQFSVPIKADIEVGRWSKGVEWNG